MILLLLSQALASRVRKRTMLPTSQKVRVDAKVDGGGFIVAGVVVRIGVWRRRDGCW